MRTFYAPQRQQLFVYWLVLQERTLWTCYSSTTRPRLDNKAWGFLWPMIKAVDLNISASKGIFHSKLRYLCTLGSRINSADLTTRWSDDVPSVSIAQTELKTRKRPKNRLNWLYSVPLQNNSWHRLWTQNCWWSFIFSHVDFRKNNWQTCFGVQYMHDAVYGYAVAAVLANKSVRLAIHRVHSALFVGF